MGSTYRIVSEREIWLDAAPTREERISARLFEEKRGVYGHVQAPQEIKIPLSVFFSDSSVMQVLVAYLHDALSCSFDQIAGILGRTYASVWSSYRQCAGNLPVSARSSALAIPVSIFKERSLGPLEALSIYLKGMGLKYSEIARMLKKDQRTIWTACHRAEKKMVASEEVGDE